MDENDQMKIEKYEGFVLKFKELAKNKDNLIGCFCKHEEDSTNINNLFDEIASFTGINPKKDNARRIIDSLYLAYSIKKEYSPQVLEIFAKIDDAYKKYGNYNEYFSS